MAGWRADPPCSVDSRDAVRHHKESGQRMSQAGRAQPVAVACVPSDRPLSFSLPDRPVREFVGQFRLVMVLAGRDRGIERHGLSSPYQTEAGPQGGALSQVQQARGNASPLQDLSQEVALDPLRPVSTEPSFPGPASPSAPASRIARPKKSDPCPAPNEIAKKNAAESTRSN